MTTEQTIKKYLRSNHKGESKAIHCDEIGKVFNLDPRTVRRHINNLRSSGVPICSSDKGYWYGKNSEEINRTIRHLTNISNEINDTRAGLIVASIKMRSITEISIEIK